MRDQIIVQSRRGCTDLHRPQSLAFRRGEGVGLFFVCRFSCFYGFPFEFSD